jgi:two-component system, NarL family, nitrate/nitrite response regulator NarL
VHYDTVLVQRSGLLREGLARLLDNSPLFHIVAMFPHFHDQVAGALPKGEPGLVLVDLDCDSIKRLKEAWPSARIAVLAEPSDADVAISAFRAGANAYLAGVTSGDALIKSLELVMAGATIFPGEMLRTILGSNCASPLVEIADSKLSAANIAALSAREAAILGCLADGSSNKVIARRLDAAEATVKVHVKAILRKIGVKNRTQAAIWALNQGGGAASRQAQGERSPALSGG